MNVISLGILLIPCLFLLGLIIGFVAYLILRKRENQRRAQFYQAQAKAEEKRSQEKELEKMKLDDL